LFEVCNLNAINSEGVLVLKVIALVDFVFPLIFAFGMTYSMFTDSFENNMHQLNIVRTHEESCLTTIKENLLIGVQYRD
jgi:hypothetical protein